jgi:DNA-3-methyladenine glycosylase II
MTKDVCMTATFTIVPIGAFELRESAEFGFGQRDGQPFGGVMRMAFVLDGLAEQVGVVLRQDADGVHGIVEGSDDVDAVQRQVARVLSLDHDARAYDALGGRDSVIGRLQDVAPGLRPPLFYSPYEATVWSVLSARRSARQMAEVRRRLADAHGTAFELAGQSTAALPTPRQLLEVTGFPGIPEEKLDRLHGVAAAALEGQLDLDRLVQLGPAAAIADLQRIKGIGPFYASLVVMRATGFTDVLPRDDPRVRDLVTDLYELQAPCTPEKLDEIGDTWRPFRTWASVLIRAAGPRLREAHAPTAR